MSEAFQGVGFSFCTLFDPGLFMNVWYFLLCCWGKSSSFLFRFNPRFAWPAFPPLSPMSLKNSPQKNQVLLNKNLIFLKLGWVKICYRITVFHFHSWSQPLIMEIHCRETFVIFSSQATKLWINPNNQSQWPWLLQLLLLEKNSYKCTTIILAKYQFYYWIE